jgi:hypothetical protein
VSLADVSPADLAAYRAARSTYLAAGDRADAAWLRWFNGETRNGAAASRLNNALGPLSADLYNAQRPLFAAEVDPADVDKLDGVQREVSYG